MENNTDITMSGGNVFEDIDVAEPMDALTKSQLALAITRIIDANEWTQAHAARVMQLDQPKVSAIKRGQLTGFSVARLMKILNNLHYSIQLTIRKSDSAEPASVVIELDQQPLFSGTSRQRG